MVTILCLSSSVDFVECKVILSDVNRRVVDVVVGVDVTLFISVKKDSSTNHIVEHQFIFSLAYLSSPERSSLPVIFL